MGILDKVFNRNKSDNIGKKPMMREIATHSDGRDITVGYVNDNIIIPNQDEILSYNGYNLDIYKDIARDDQVKTCRGQRELALISKEWIVEPGDESAPAKKAADRLEETLKRIEWDDKTKKMLGSVLYGYSAAEIIWGVDGSEIIVEDIKVRDRSRFGFLPDGELRLITSKNQVSGEKLPPAKFWAFSCGADTDDHHYGLGLGHHLYWPVHFKKNGIKYWIKFLEKFGQPTAKGKYQQGASPEDRKKLLETMYAMNSSSAIAIPDSMEVELIEAVRSGTADYTELYDRMNAAISKIYLGHTGTTEATPGKLGSDETALNVREDIIKADADLVCGSFNRTVARWLTQYNDGDGVAPPRVYRKVAQEEDLNSVATRDKTIFDMGFKPTIQYISEQYGDNYQEKPEEAPVKPMVPAKTAKFAEAQEVDLTPVDSMTDILAKDANQEISEWAKQIAGIAEQSGSLEDLRDKLLVSYGDLDSEKLRNIMTIAFASANLSGRFDVTNNF